MSDNPEPILDLGVEDDGSLQRVTEAFRARLDEIAASAVEAFRSGDEAAAKFLATLDEIGKQAQIGLSDVLELSAEETENWKNKIADLDAQVTKVTEDYQQLAQAATQASEAVAAVPASSGASDTSSGDSGSDTQIGSAFGIGHGLSVAGHALGSPAMREAGGLIYIEEALRRVGPLFEQMNTALEASGGLIPPLAEGLTNLGVPMADLVATAGPLAVAVGLAAVAVGNFSNMVQHLIEQIDKASDAQVKYYEFVATATTEDAKKRIEADTVVQSANERGMHNLIDKMQPMFKTLGITPEQQAEILADPNSKLRPGKAGSAAGFELDPLLNQFFKLKDAADTAGQDVDALTNGIQKGDFAINDAAKDWRDMGASTAKAAQQTADFNRQLTADSQMSSAQIEKRIPLLKQDTQNIQDQMDTLKPYIGTNAALKTQYDDLNTKLQQEKEEIGLLSTTFLDNALAAEAMKEAAKEAEKAVDDMAKANVNYAKGVQAAEDQLASQTATVKQRELDAERQYTEGSLQDTFERTKIATAESRKVLDIEQQTSDKIVDIVTKFGQKQSDLALDLRRQEDDDVTKYNDSVAKAELDARRTEQSDLADHLQKLADIRSQDKLSQENALLNRQFGELRQLQNKEQQDIQNEDTSYQRREDKLKEHLAQQEEDLFRGLQQEEKAQTLAEQRKVEDATRTAQREIEAANLAEQRKVEAAQQAEQLQLQDLTTNENYKLQLLRIGLQDELTLMAQAEAAKLQLLAATRDAIIEQALGIPAANAQALAQLPFSPASFGGIGIGDSGGSFGPGQPWMKGGLMETLDFGGRNAVNVGGSALIYPLSSGTVTPVSQSEHTVHFAPTLNIYPSSGQEIDGKRLMNEMYSQLEALLEK